MIASLYTKIISQIVFPLHERLKSHRSVSIRKSLESSQWMSRAAIIEKRDLRLKQFIADSYRDVPYIKSLFTSLNLTPCDIKSSADLSKLPLLTKSVIRQNFEQLKSLNAVNMTVGNTGGSSGAPLIFMLGKDRVSHDVAQKWRATRWWDVDIGDKELVAWGSPIELNSQDRLRRLRDGLFRSYLLPAFDLNPSKINQFITQIKTQQPAMLFGYPSVYAVIAQQARDLSIDLTNLGIKVVFVTSERLYDHQRQLLEQVFGCKVANGYGGRDAGFIAHQCKEGGMHISAEDIIVEIVDQMGQVVPDGISGEVVVTHLASGDFPFIRYRTGDIATISTASCSCGRGLPMLESIDGRSTDFVIASDGNKMHGLCLIYILREIEQITEFKIIQQSIDLTEIKLVCSELTPKLEECIRTSFQQRLGSDVEIAIEKVKTIENEKSGKFRYVVSHISTN